MTDNTGSVDTTGNPAAVTATPGTEPWYAAIENPELKGYAELKGFKDPSAVLDSYRNLETKLGAPPDRLLRLPEKPDAPEWQDIYNKVGLGRPGKAEDYGIQVPEGIDPSYATKMAQVAFETGVPKRHLDALIKANADFANAEETRIQEMERVAGEQAITGLKQSWGGLYDQNVELARRSAAEMGTTVGLDAEKLQAIEGALGTADFLKLFAAVGSKNNQEARVLDGVTQTGFSMSPEAAAAKMNSLMQDGPWYEKWKAGGAQERAEFTKLSHIKAGYKPQ